MSDLQENIFDKVETETEDSTFNSKQNNYYEFNKDLNNLKETETSNSEKEYSFYLIPKKESFSFTEILELLNSSKDVGNQ